MNKIKNFFSKAQNKANELVINAKTALQNKSGEGYIDTAVKIIIGVVIGSLILVGLYALFNGVGCRETFVKHFISDCRIRIILQSISTNTRCIPF